MWYTYNAATRLESFDLRFAALLAWMMFFFASLSIIAITPGKAFVASFLLVISRKRRIAFLAVLCWKRLRKRFFSFERILFNADL